MTIESMKIKLRQLNRWLVRQHCKVRGHYWWMDEQGARCARCGTPAW